MTDKNHFSKFNSDLTEAPFDKCCVCEVDFLSTGVKYLVEKNFKRVAEGIEYAVYEYAICWNCAQSFQQKISEGSNQAIQNYFFTQLQNRPPRLFSEDEDSIAVCLSECLVKGTKTSQLLEYTICGLFKNSQFALDAMPYALSGEVLEELSARLSPETKDEMDQFRDTHFGGPPEFEELFKGKPVVFL